MSYYPIAAVIGLVATITVTIVAQSMDSSFLRGAVLGGVVTGSTVVGFFLGMASE